MKVGVACSGHLTPCMLSGGRRWRWARGGDWRSARPSSRTWQSRPKSTSRWNSPDTTHQSAGEHVEQLYGASCVVCSALLGSEHLPGDLTLLIIQRPRKSHPRPTGLFTYLHAAFRAKQWQSRGFWDISFGHPNFCHLISSLVGDGCSSHYLYTPVDQESEL